MHDNPERSRMKTYRDKTCLICNIVFTPTGQNNKYCKPCAEQKWKNKAAEYQQSYRIRNGIIKNPGVGSGNGVPAGKEHHSYKTGIGYFHKNAKRIKEERRYCNRCNKDLIDATRYHWCIQHIDHDRTNNVDSNFELLCKRCHQIEHECHKAFGTSND